MAGRSILRVAILAWTVFGLACTLTALWTMRAHGHAPWKIATYNVLVWNAWVPVTLAIAALGRRWPPRTVPAIALHFACALVVGVVHHVWWTAMLVTIHPYDAMGVQTFSPAVFHDVTDRFFLETTLYFAALGLTYAADRTVRSLQLEASLARARLTALELQLRPHFLFNTLHAIGGLVRQNRSSEAVEMIAGLSDLLRYSLDHAEHLVSLDEEIAVVKRYLAIQALRFSDRLQTTIDVPDDVLACRVPPLLLQPLVENAIEHGVERVSHAAMIAIRARRDGAHVVIQVENTAPGPIATEGVGIANTRARLEQLFGDRHALALARTGDRVVATVRVPA